MCLLYQSPLRRFWMTSLDQSSSNLVMAGRTSFALVGSRQLAPIARPRGQVSYHAGNMV